MTMTVNDGYGRCAAGPVIGPSGVHWAEFVNELGSGAMLHWPMLCGGGGGGSNAYNDVTTWTATASSTRTLGAATPATTVRGLARHPACERQGRPHRAAARPGRWQRDGVQERCAAGRDAGLGPRGARVPLGGVAEVQGPLDAARGAVGGECGGDGGAMRVACT